MSFKDITYDPNTDSILFRSRKSTQKNVSIPASGGYLPLGAIIPVLVDSPVTAGAYGVPATGTVDANGWMLCDGTAIPAGQKLGGSTPNLSEGRYFRGSTGSGTTGGSNTMTSALLPSHTHAIDHDHASISTEGNSAATDGPSTANTGSGAAAIGNDSPDHNHTQTGLTGQTVGLKTNTYFSGAAQTGYYSFDRSYSGTNGTSGAGARHSHTDSGHTHSLSDHTHTMANHTHTVDLPNFTGTSGSTGSGTTGNNEPQYLNVRYLIRVN